ncbi:MAG: YARHG domain-containing protein [Treponema sp.]|nr:YARHG domain-containing protein [Treponema sp.]
MKIKDLVKKSMLGLMLILLPHQFFFSQSQLDNTKIKELVKDNREIDYNYISEIYSLDNGYYIALIEFEDIYKIYIISNDSKFTTVDIESSSKKNYKNLIKCGKADVYSGDLTYDGLQDIMWIKLRQGPVLEIYKLDLELETEYLELLYPPAIYYSDTNPRISDANYMSFDDVQFCIVNGKRGIRVYSIGEFERSRNDSTDEVNYYEAVLEKSKASKYYFFYWSPSEQKYILDETVTQTQIKNAYCPEEYFAYNGLDFSKLEKALKKSDIKDLTPAQLRLMRNAIYARHGRIFNSVDLQSLWECYTWYKPNPDYNDNMLTKTDKKNLKLIQDIEKVTGTYEPDLPR